MDAKLDCEVDVEGTVGAVDMMGGERASLSRRPYLRPNTAHSPSLESTLQAGHSPGMAY